jgi:REP element-mobilizing transposase RayT
MDEMESLSHTKWECKYHVVFIPKCRRKVLYGELRRHLGEVLRKLAEQKESRIFRRDRPELRIQSSTTRAAWCTRSSVLAYYAKRRYAY